jgi:glyceraldehyde-3-phosphate dehydrogenase (NADP+)
VSASERPTSEQSERPTASSGERPARSASKRPAAFGLLIGGTWRAAGLTVEVRNSFAGEVVGTIGSGSVADVRDGVDAAVEALRNEFPMHARYDVLMRAADLVDVNAELYAVDLAMEGHKTIREARREPPRSANVLRLAAEEGRRLGGETLPFDIKPGSENRQGFYMRVPVGVVAAILPFNDPLAVMAHKVGPALAGGNAVVVKPDSRSPLAVLRLAGHLVEAGLPAGRLSVITGDGLIVGAALVKDPRVRMITFTGGVATGELIAASAGMKKLALELGANSAVLVLRDADLGRASSAIVDGAFAQAGQNCLGVQRVFAESEVYDELLERVVERTGFLRAGASLDETADVCPLITEAEAIRVEQMILDATSKGARVATGGSRTGAVLAPTVLIDVPSGCRIDTDEAYGPVVAIYRIKSVDEGIARANEVAFGLHAAVFTNNLEHAFRAIRKLQVGGVIINDSTDYRLDTMPFGGVKQSGFGREGVRFAIEEMTETRVVCFNV